MVRVRVKMGLGLLRSIRSRLSFGDELNVNHYRIDFNNILVGFCTALARHFIDMQIHSNTPFLTEHTIHGCRCLDDKYPSYLMDPTQ